MVPAHGQWFRRMDRTGPPLGRLSKREDRLKGQPAEAELPMVTSALSADQRFFGLNLTTTSTRLISYPSGPCGNSPTIEFASGISTRLCSFSMKKWWGSETLVSK